jgi:hypothetical protein
MRNPGNGDSGLSLVVCVKTTQCDLKVACHVKLEKALRIDIDCDLNTAAFGRTGAQHGAQKALQIG